MCLDFYKKLQCYFPKKCHFSFYICLNQTQGLIYKCLFFKFLTVIG